MRGCIVFACALACFAVAGAACAEEAPVEMHYRFSIDHDFVYNRVSGPGAERSILTPGWSFLTLFYVDLAGRVHDIDVVNLSLGLKLTDDERQDPRALSLMTLRGSAANDYFVLTLGDTFESFSPYSLAGPIKGGSVRLMPSGERDGLQVVAVHGIAYPRWDNYRSSSPALRRQVSGLRVHAPVLERRGRLGISFVHNDDSEPIFAGQTMYENRVLAADFEMEIIPGLTMRAESSYAETGESDETGPGADYSGTAHRLELVAQGGPSRVQLDYERVSTDFASTMGSAVSDRERYRARWRYRVNPDVTMTTAYLYYHDDVSGRTGPRTKNHKPELGLTWRRPGGRTFGVLDMRYRLDLARSTDRDTTDHFVTLGHRDRFGVFDFDTNLGYNRFDTTNQRNARDYTYNTNISSRHDLGRYVLRPQLFLGGWTNRDDLASETDQVWEQSFGLGFEIPERNLNYNLRIGRHELKKDAADSDSRRNFARLSVNHRPARWQDSRRVMLTLQASYNDFAFDAHGDYSEFSAKLSVRVDI